MSIKDDKRYEDLSYMTGVVNMMASNINLDYCCTTHCIERQRERNITVSDIRYVLRCGRVDQFIEKVNSSMKNRKFYKYRITGDYLGDERSTREISLIILVEVDKMENPAIKVQKIITAMWKDLKDD
jgi:hypothetical protein